MFIGVRGHDFGRMEIETLARFLHDQGYEAAQIAPWKAFTGIEGVNDITPEKRERIRASFAAQQVRIPVLGCYVDLGNPDAEIRGEAVDRLKKCLAYSKEMGAEVVGTETSYARPDPEQKKAWFPYMLDSVQRVVEEAQRLDATLAIEPVCTHVLDSIDAVLQVMETVQDERHLRMIFDAVNVLEPDNIGNQPAHWTKWLKYTGKYICALHVKDFMLKDDDSYEPVPLGTGLMEYEVISKWLHENGRDLCLLREEQIPEYARQDMRFLRSL